MLNSSFNKGLRCFVCGCEGCVQVWVRNEPTSQLCMLTLNYLMVQIMPQLSADRTTAWSAVYPPLGGTAIACVLLMHAGMTKSGKQPTPEWLQKVLGVEVPKVEGEGQTLEQLLGPKPE